MPDTSPHPPSHLVAFGKTDLRVSRLCQGTAFRQLSRSEDDPRVQQVLARALELGVNFFDSANGYGSGGSEKALGRAVAGRRDQVVICTKVGASYIPEQESGEAKPARFTREFLFHQVEGSLGRLGTDYIDLYMLHKPDRVTPAEESADAMDALMQAGKIRYWGVSNHSAAQVRACVEWGQRTGGTPIAGIEDYYNIAGSFLDKTGASRVRTMEEEMFPLLRQTGLGLLAFSPLDTGKLAPGRPVKPGTPPAGLLDTLDRIARELGVRRTAVCIAWVLTHPEVTSVLAGAESPDHVEENLSSTQLVLPDHAIATLNAAHDSYSARIEKGETDE